MSGVFGQAPGKLTKVRYIGMFLEVTVPAADNVKVEQGGIIEVPNELAEAMCEQVTNWELVLPAPKKKKTTKKVKEEVAIDEESE